MNVRFREGMDNSCRSTTKIALAASLLLAVAAPSANAQTSSEGEGAQSVAVEGRENPSPYILTRPTLTGDWGGTRSALAARGVALDLRYTSLYQGLLSGDGNQSFEYGGKFDAFVGLDSDKLGLWDGGGLHTHLEYRHGDAAANRGGAIFATNAALFWPGSPDTLVATSLYASQKLGDRSSIAVGKFNPVDLLAADPYYGGWGIDRHMNLILTAPPSGLVPVVFMGAVASHRVERVSWTLMVFDPNDRTDDYFPGDLFEDGVNLSLGGAYATAIAGRKTTFAATALYSSAEGTDYSTLAPGLETTTKKGSYNVSFEFKHNVLERADGAWGFFLKAAIADGNPNYVQSSIIAGIGGRALFLGRPQDTFGLAAYRYNLSDTLQSALSSTTRFRDEQAIVGYYSHAMTPWLHLGVDLQYVQPAAGSFDNATILGLRMQVRL